MPSNFADDSVSSDSKNGLLCCIDRGLDYFGSDVRTTIYWILENKYQMTRRDALARPEEFSKSLEKIFGAGAKIVERKMVDQIRASYGISNSREDLVYAVNSVKSMVHEI